jgi:hypothetical protein
MRSSNESSSLRSSSRSCAASLDRWSTDLDGHLAGVEIVHALACTGVPVARCASASFRQRRAVPATLAATGDASLRGVQNTQPRVDDVAATVRYLISVVRDKQDQNAAFVAWHTIVASCAAGEADPATLLWIARSSSTTSARSRWWNRRLGARHARARSAIRTARRRGAERARVQLVEDPIGFAPGRKRGCNCGPPRRTRSASSSTGRSTSSVASCRGALVDPWQSTAPAGAIVGRLLDATPASPEARLPIADAINALACIGVEIPEILLTRVIYWLPGLTAVDPRFRSRASRSRRARVRRSRCARYVTEPRGDLPAGSCARTTSWHSSDT